MSPSSLPAFVQVIAPGAVQLRLKVVPGSSRSGMAGPLGDRFGRKGVIWASILGVAPFSLALPHAGLVGTVDEPRKGRFADPVAKAVAAVRSRFPKLFGSVGPARLS